MGDLFDRPATIILILVVVILLFGSKKLPDAARGLGRSLRIFKAETKGLMTDDEAAAGQQAAPVAPQQIAAPPAVPPPPPIVQAPAVPAVPAVPQPVPHEADKSES